MRIQSKMVSILSVVSGLVLTSACAEQQEEPAQSAPEAIDEQEAAVGAVPAGCEGYPGCPSISDLWYAQNGYIGGFVCAPAQPDQIHLVKISKWTISGWVTIAQNVRAKVYNPGLEPHCGGKGNHAFNIYVGDSGGPGYYRLNTWVVGDAFSPYSLPTQVEKSL